MRVEDGKQRSIKKMKTPKSYEEIKEAIGEAACDKLCDTFGGEMIYIPKIDRIKTNKRNQDIRHEYEKGTSIEKIARKYRVTTRRIRQIIKK